MPGQTETLRINAEVVSSQNLLNTAILNAVNETDRDDSNNSDTAEVSLTNCLSIPEGISPNSDGLNDTLIIPCIEDYPENQLQIFTRYGNLVYDIKGYKNQWNGIPNTGLLKSNEILPVGTYFYVLRRDLQSEPIVGWIYLNY